MQKLIALIGCYCWFLQLTAQPNIVAAEYFINTDPGFGKASPIVVSNPLNNIANLPFSAAIGSLPQGVHSLFIRSRDANGKWSVTNRFVFFKPSLTIGLAASNIVKAEYFFDTDPGFGLATNIAITAGADVQNVNFGADVSGLSVGVHSLYIRSRNANGVWSITNRQLLYKPVVTSTPANSNIVKAEYFFDTDPGFGLATNIPISAGADVQNINLEADISGLSVGVHSLYIRSTNANGIWSITNRKLLYKPTPASTLPPAAITQVEYFFDSDPGFGNAVPVVVNPAGIIADFNAPVNISGLAPGDHTLFFRSRTSSGWSITNAYTVPIAANAALPFINVNAVNKKTMCAADSLKISYDAKGIFNAGNIFNVQLSNANGSFTSPVIIGSYTGINSAIIACKIPNTITGGSNFRVRVTSTNPVVTGMAGSDALTIGNKSQAQSITGAVDANGSFNYAYNIPAVTGSTWKWIVAGGIQQSGSNTNNIGVIWASPTLGNSAIGTIKLVETNYGCSGDTSNLTATIYKLRIANSTAATACKGFGLTINAIADGAFVAGNIITAQLSDATGSFAAPLSIGSVALVGNGFNQGAIINAIIPVVVNGVNYRVRLTSSTGSFIGDTSTAILIQKPNLGADITRNKCLGFTYDLSTVYNTVGLTYSYFTQAFASIANPSAVETGVFQIVATNGVGCKDTAQVTVTNFVKPNLGADITVYHVCAGETTNLIPLYNTSGLIANWNTVNTTAAIPGIYRLIVTNTSGCTDTAFVTVILEVATWTGAVSNDWHTAGNWSTNKMPTLQTHVIIPAGKPNQCAISTADAEASSIQVRAGAALQLSANRKLLLSQKCTLLPAN